MEASEEIPQIRFTDFFENERTIKYIVSLTLLFAMFIPAATRTDNGVMIETIYYFPWAVFRIFNPSPAYSTRQMQVLFPISTILIMLPTYYVIFETFNLLKENQTLYLSFLKISGAELAQVLLIFLTLQSGASNEVKDEIFWGQLFIMFFYLVSAALLYLEKAKLELYKT